MYLLLFVSILSFHLSSVFAVFGDEAYNVDFHYALLGQPIQHSTFFYQPHATSKASLLYTVTDKAVLGAINPRDGSLVWRQHLGNGNRSKPFLRPSEGQHTVISAFGDAVTAWNAADGKLVWRSSFQGHQIEDLEITDLPSASDGSNTKDFIALYSGKHPTLRRLNAETGDIKWEYQDDSGDTINQTLSSLSAIFVLSLHQRILGHAKIKMTELNAITGQKTDQRTISSEMQSISAGRIIYVGPSSPSPLLAWMDKSFKVLKIHIIGTKHTTSITVPVSTGSGEVRVTLHAPYKIGTSADFLLQYEDLRGHWAEIYHVDLSKQIIVKSFDIPRVTGQGTFSASTVDATVYFTHVTSEEISIISSTTGLTAGQWAVNKNSVSDAESHTGPAQVVSEVIPKSGSSLAIRSAVLLSNGDWVLIRNGVLDWRRPEALADAEFGVWADYPEPGLLKEVVIESHQSVFASYTHRLQRHIKQLKSMRTWMEKIQSRFISLVTGKASSTTDVGSNSFGFRKLLLFATGSGRLLAIDTGLGGAVLWNVDGADYVDWEDWKDVSFHIPARGFLELKTNELTSYISTTTGKLLSKVEVAEPHSTIEVRGSEPAVTYRLMGNKVVGILGGQTSRPLWTFSPPGDQRIISVRSRPAEDPVASIGRMLGDRRVLYKYLNANMALIMTTHENSQHLFVYLVDTISGNVLYSCSHEGIDLTRPITSALSENWMVYSYTANHPKLESRGPLLVATDLYESSLPNDRGPFGAASNFSALEISSALGDAAKPHAVSQTFILSEEISKISVTHTRQGISSRHLLVSVPQSGSVVSIPRLVIDPRRPIGRDPTTEEAKEGLSKYNSYLNFDPRWYLSHRRDVIGIEKIQASPSKLESTSIVVAYGLDVFGTRVSPSHSFDRLGKEFNKLQMLGTVFMLFIILLFVAPIVKRKKINAQWQNL